MLTPKQNLFISYFIRYNCSSAEASRAMGAPLSYGRSCMKDRVVVTEIRRRINAISAKMECTVERVLAEYAKIAFHDPSKVFEHRRERCGYCWAGGGPDTPPEPDPECTYCRGEGEGRVFVRDTRDLGPNERASLTAIIQKETGTEVKLADKKAALDSIAKHLGMFVERVQLSTAEGTGVLLVPAAMSLEQWQANAKKVAPP